MNLFRVSLFLSLFFAAGLQAQDEIELEISPEEPTDRDEVVVTVSGEFPHTGVWFEDIDHGLQGNRPVIEMHIFDCGFGGQMIVPWVEAINWGRLETGRYEVIVLLYYRFQDEEEDGPYMMDGSFSVTEGEPYLMEIELTEGWNLVSSYIEPDEPDIRSLFTTLTDEGILRFVKDAGGRFYWPEYDFNNIPQWNVNEGYYVNVSEDTELTFEGGGIACNHPIPLRRGWNIAAYFPEDDIEAYYAFRNIRNILITAKDNEGRFYNPGHRFNNMEPLTRGQGYMLKVSENGVIEWCLQQ